MKAIWRSAAAALVLASTCSIPSFGQQYHDEDNGPSYGEGHRMHQRGDYDERSEGRQSDGRMDRGGDRWRFMAAMMARRGGARFQFSRGDARIDIRCPQNEALQDCVDAASRLIDKVHSLEPGSAQQGAGHQ
jgi:hypothetical protein